MQAYSSPKQYVQFRQLVKDRCLHLSDCQSPK